MRKIPEISQNSEIPEKSLTSFCELRKPHLLCTLFFYPMCKTLTCDTSEKGTKKHHWVTFFWSKITLSVTGTEIGKFGDEKCCIWKCNPCMTLMYEGCPIIQVHISFYGEWMVLETWNLVCVWRGLSGTAERKTGLDSFFSTVLRPWKSCHLSYPCTRL